MRLQEMYHICKAVLDNYGNVAVESFKSNGGSGTTYYKIKNRDQIEGVLKALKPLDLFTPNIARLYGVSSDVAKGKWNLLTEKEKDGIVREYSEIKNKLTHICDFCAFLNVPENADGFDVKMPSKMTFDDLSKSSRDIGLVLSRCPYLRDSECKAEIESVDIGSIWLTVTIIGVAGAAITMFLKSVAELVDVGVAIRSHMLTLREQEEAARQQGLAGDLLDGMVKAHNALLDSYVGNAVTTLSEKHGVSDPADITELQFCVNQVTDLLNRGIEIYASVGAGQDVKAVFPPVEGQKLPEAAMKLLEEHVKGKKS